MVLSTPPLALSPPTTTTATLHILPSSGSDPPYKLLQNHPSLTLLSKCKSMHHLKQIHSHFIKSGLHNTHFAQSKLIEFCIVSASGDLSYALSIFNSIEQPNVFIWNTIIRGHSSSSSSFLALDFYVRMILSGVEPNSYTFPFVLKSCAKMGATHEGEQIHAHVLKFGLDSDAFVHTSLIHMYAQNGELSNAQLVFDKSSFRDVISFTALITGYALKGCMDNACHLFNKMPHRDVVSWNAMISGYAQCSRLEEALSLFNEMKEANFEPNESTIATVLSACARTGYLEMGNSIHSWIQARGFDSNLKLVNALIDMYSKCGEFEKARDLFNYLNKKDVISWNAMIGGYTHSSNYREALILFCEMLRSDVEPNEITLLCVLPACAYLGALDLGKWIHIYINKNFNKTQISPALSTSLIDLYAKCGDIEAAKQVFERLKVKTLASCNAMISGSAMHGHSKMAIDLFSDMTINGGIKPDDITFVGVLSACNHSGSIDLGRDLFTSMVQYYNISPKLQHYGCMIDLLGRAGLFEEAELLMKNMEMDPDGPIWGSLLRACWVHGKVEFGEFVAEQLFKLEPENPGAYVLLSNIYARAQRWDDVARIRTKLKDKGMKKVPGCTSIEVDSIVHEFLVGDRVHPQSKEIYKMLDEIDMVLEKSGFVPDTSEVLYDIDEEWKEDALSHHSEKLAIAFGLISTKPGTKIKIVKNLRVCGNCHEATKMISKIFSREIIARDRNFFHHFKDGSCSCKDYW